MLQAQTLMEVERTLGQAKEEEPEGEVIVGPSGEAVKPSSSGYTLLFSFRNQIISFSSFFQKLIHLDQASADQIF